MKVTAVLFFIFTLFWTPVLCDVCPRRRLLKPKMATVSCSGVEYSNKICDDYLTDKGYSKLSDVQFPKLQPEVSATTLENIGEIQTLSELVGTYMCCEISKISLWDYKKLSFIYEEFCDANYGHFSHHKSILGFANDNAIKIGHFAVLVSFCPARIVKQNPSADVATPWEKISPAVNTNANVRNTKVVSGECEKIESTPIGGTSSSAVEEENVFTILLADEDVYYGSLKAFVGPIDQLTEDKFMIWAADEPMYSLEIVRNIHGTPAELYPMKISRAIQFKATDNENVRQAWEEWIQNERYSLLNRSCVHSVVNLLKAALPAHKCTFNEDLEFPFPLSTFEQIVQIGAQTSSGEELNFESIDQIQGKINNILEEKRAASHTDC